MIRALLVVACLAISLGCDCEQQRTVDEDIIQTKKKATSSSDLAVVEIDGHRYIVGYAQNGYGREPSCIVHAASCCPK